MGGSGGVLEDEDQGSRPSSRPKTVMCGASRPTEGAGVAGHNIRARGEMEAAGLCSGNGSG